MVLIILVTCHVTSTQLISQRIFSEIDFGSGKRSYGVLTLHGLVVNRDTLFGQSNTQSSYKVSLQKIAFQS